MLPFRKTSVVTETPLKALAELWWSKDRELWKLEITLETFSSVTLDFSEKTTICCLKLSTCFWFLEDSGIGIGTGLIGWAGEPWQDVLFSHFSASSHFEGTFFLEKLPTLKLKTGLPGVGGASILLCMTEFTPLLWDEMLLSFTATGNDLTNSEVSLRLSLQSGSSNVSTTANGLPLLFPQRLVLRSIVCCWITRKQNVRIKVETWKTKTNKMQNAEYIPQLKEIKIELERTLDLGDPCLRLNFLMANLKQEGFFCGALVTFWTGGLFVCCRISLLFWSVTLSHKKVTEK